MRVEPSVKDALENAAKADRRTVAAYVEKLIVDDLEEKSFLPKEGPASDAKEAADKSVKPRPIVNLGHAGMKSRRHK
ncbi:hypothetical protein X733_22475 [Mesorhizobium sp. L2C067A000]|nr:hypothetical protein X733_22475 [Mesorhizobium sp. L2C067A000]